MKILWTLCLLAFVTLPTRADDPISADRPTFSNGPQIVGPGKIQLESGVQYLRGGDEKDLTFGQAIVRIGAGGETEARIGINSYHFTRSGDGKIYGFEDSTLGVKYKLSDGAKTFDLSKPQAAILVQTTVPTGASAFREKTLQPSAGIILNWMQSSHFQFGTNLTAMDTSLNGTHYGEFLGTLNATYSLSARVSGLLDYYLDRRAGGESPNTTYLDGGITYLTNDDTQLDINGGVGFNHQSPDYFLGAGIARRF